MDALFKRRTTKSLEPAMVKYMEAFHHQMIEAKKNERANALKASVSHCKGFSITAGMLKGSLAERRKNS